MHDKIAAKKAKIAELDYNIQKKQEERNVKGGRLSYYQGMLVSNNARGSAANLVKNRQAAGRASSLTQSAGKPKGTMKADGVPTTQVGFGGGRVTKSKQQIAFNQ